MPVDRQVTAWLANVYAGRIGATDPDIAANRDATTRLFARPKGRW